MSLWIVVGGQFGSEGKGKIAAHIVQQEGIDVCIRCGGPNSGHSVTIDSRTVVLRQLPTGYINKKTRLLIPAGALIDLDVLRNEIETIDIDPSRVGVDRNTMVIDQRDKDYEARIGLQQRLSSTLCGVGSAVSRRALRGADVSLAHNAVGHAPWLKPLITDVAAETNYSLDSGRKVLVEGTQGFGLSLYHSDFYPKTTSRDTTPAGFLSEVGLSPLLVSEIVLVLRTFPIRVAGEQAGPLKDEISWEQLQRESGYPEHLGEWTSVSKRLRRVGRFDWDLATRAATVTRPTAIALNGLDYFDYRNRKARSLYELMDPSRQFIGDVECRLHAAVRFVGTGPESGELFTTTNSLVGERQAV